MKFNIFRKGCVGSKYSDGYLSVPDLLNLSTDSLVDKFRGGDTNSKKYIPAFCPMGVCDEKNTRTVNTMSSNGLCMVDLDHIEGDDFEKIKELTLAQKEAFEMMEFFMAYITCSGKGFRFVFPMFEGFDVSHSQLAFTMAFFPDYVKYLDTCTTDVSRLSILTKKSDYLILKDCLATSVLPKQLSGETLFNKVVSISNVKEYVKNIRSGNDPSEHSSEPPCSSNENDCKGSSPIEGKTEHREDSASPVHSEVRTDSTEQGGELQRESERSNQTDNTNIGVSSTDSELINPDGIDTDNVPFREYSVEKIIECDKMFSEYPYKGRKVREIANAYIQYKTRGRGPECGERHALYGLLCTNFRNLCNNDPRIMHAVLPDVRNDGHDTITETWKQCVWTITHSRSINLPKEFYFWCKDNGFLEWPVDDESSEVNEEDMMYEMFLKKMPSMPPIIREFVKIAPKWFKIPVIASLQCYTALLCTNHRSWYFDGSPISPTLYTLVYAPAASGKSYTKKLRVILKRIEQRDKLALEKAKWYDRQQRQNNGSGKLPEEVVWKQQLFSSKTSMGEVLKRQEAIGEHHWLQDISEFSIWAATVKKAKEEWSAFFRTSYDNEEFSQSYQSANAYRGKVAVFPIVHGTCTFGQIASFFTNVEDGLLTRFSFVPLMHQRYASYQPWKLMSDRDQANVDKVVKRLEWETYSDIEEEPEEKDDEQPVAAEEEEKPKESKPKKEKDDRSEWDYDFKEPIWHEMEYVHEALLQWLERKRLEALKDDNEALDTFRRRCARNAFAFALVCRALWGRNDAKTKEKIVACAIWDAEVKLYYMRYVWENKMNEELMEVQKKKKTKPVAMSDTIYDKLPNIFTRERLSQALMAAGFRTNPYKMISMWRTNGFIKEISKGNFQKINQN